MKRLLIALSLSVAALHGFAQTQRPTSESIEKLLTLTKSEALYESSIDGMDGMMKDMMSQALGQQKVTPEQQKAIDQLPAKILALFKEDFKYALLKPIFIQIYSESFSQNEIDAMLTFYQTPAGTAVIDKMPIVMQKSMKMTQEMMAKTMPKMIQMLEENFKETLKKK